MLLPNLDLYGITVTLPELIDFFVITFIVYYAYKWTKGTIAFQIFLGMLVVLASTVVAKTLELRALSWLLRTIADAWVVGFLILFQPEIRKFLIQLGRRPFGLQLFEQYDTDNDTAKIITDAAFKMSAKNHGALIVLQRGDGLQDLIDAGENIQARTTSRLLQTIFYPKTPLHDGAVIIQNNTIVSARCALPISRHRVYKGLHLGMRHRAGLGISEKSDVVCLIVSEETGEVSIATGGKLFKGLNEDTVLHYLISKEGEKHPENKTRKYVKVDSGTAPNEAN